MIKLIKDKLHKDKRIKNLYNGKKDKFSSLNKINGNRRVMLFCMCMEHLEVEKRIKFIWPIQLRQAI
jgi:hypothetical protein